MQNDATVENMRAMTDFVRQYGVYSQGHSSPQAPCSKSDYSERHASQVPASGPAARTPGTVVSWEEKRREFGALSGNVPLLQDVWEGVDGLAYTYIWQILLSF